ncbi:hypothetical protein A2V54_02535 [candidate division WWE3 bacterium RBG_19FT_COMBO_53_11]|uniref:DUF86 domain-containing protein n=1 Tax=candidate division WWE3 bacterium RBG_19FT_COMBO_53_11 TaxID=1802613 RepID=A0A1F4UI01_UNCKA|nr:MAG: hypothetical protein A2155_00450 [candidate division WWE3 bacterium RBG_16_52_45]OGC44549.1 MAG: hypothetical protein A2V54_02535 [candidate division WWE3 bacterium RBG_19FT_COMBO_53_11]
MVLEFLFGKKPAGARGRTSVGFLKPYDKEKVAQDWERIAQLAETNRPSAYKEAVIVADKLLDYVLTQISSGEAMGERLKNADEAFPRDIYQGIWDAHKMRNALVHEPNFDLTTLVARDVLEKFKRGFQSLGVTL